MRAPGKLKFYLIFPIIFIIFVLLLFNIELLHCKYLVIDNLFNFSVPIAYNKDKFKHVIIDFHLN